MRQQNLREPGKTHYRTIFLSDIHLGTKGCQAERLLEFLKQHTCDRLYLVGDIVDGWRMKSSIYWSQSHSNVLRRFLTLTKRGTQVVYVTGNHDEFLRRYSDLAIGHLELVDEAVHDTADGRRLLVVHGDEYDVITRYHRWVAFLGDLGYTLLLALNRHFNALRSRLGYGYWSLSAWLKHRVKRAVNFISEFEEAVVHQCHKRGFDGVVCGHIHHAEIREIQGLRYLNCGDWVESCTALVEDEHGRFEILDWSRRAPAATVVPLPAAAAGVEPERGAA
ncbi:MAG: UDP-2,3-diacylglucosamine hydrolase [Gammaproteobacteria bacterium]|nr:UDP-2,3-diacylglucosamine hydrolase [Gammaproteobacteria bacterium]|tara:strand:- start:964 stop:1797 length:834 start_codon:yes stop_codon:yes gene_type:complete